MKVAVTGGTGFVGKHLVRHLLDHGHEVIVISRRASVSPYGAAVITWEHMERNPSVMEGTEVIVNLAGESINQRWTKSAKERILSSRIEAAHRIASIVARLEHKPRVVINGSGMSIYGTSEADSSNEESPKRIVDFLSGVVEVWERAAEGIKGVRLVKIRTGLVLGNDGGALPKMLLPYRLGVGGRIGSGKQWNSWIHIDDLVRLLVFCMERGDICGPVNATAPFPVRNDEFGRTIGCMLSRPHWMPVPGFMFQLLFGELSELLLKGQRVLPGVLQKNGFAFQFPTIDEALRDLLRSGSGERK